MRGLRITFLLAIVATFVVFQNASKNPGLNDSKGSQNSTAQRVVEEEEPLQAVNGSLIYYRELQAIQALNNSKNYSTEIRRNYRNRAPGAKTYESGQTSLSQLSDDDFNAMLGNQPPSQQLYQANIAKKRYQAGSSQPLPMALDWRKKGAVTPVKNQGRCASCWSFATAGALEAQTKIKTGKLVPLSAKQLVDCAGGLNVCGKGGNVFNALQYVMANGLKRDDDYPYKPQQSACQSDSDSRNIALQFEQRDKPGMYLPPGNIGEIKNALVNYGPLIVSLHVDSQTWKGYKGGVFLEPTCNNDRWKVNHSVLLVGYNKTMINGQLLRYWIIKNSWGPNWGIGGYMHIASGQQQCAIEEWVLQPATQ